MEVCTIIAKNYVAHARVLARSLAEHNPGSRLWTLIIDDFERYIDPAEEPFEVLTPDDIGCDAFTYMALRYTVLELSTAVKPWLLRHLMGRTGGPITYLDPDIEVYGSLQLLDDMARQHGVALIPHNNEPLPADGRKPSQVDVMIAGVYNLGYVSLAPGPEVDRLLDWWSDRLRRDCRVDPVWGYFVDQRWFDLVPGFLTDFAIIREPEYNVAYWNLHSRRLEQDGERYLVDGRPLAFFHFSGFDPEHPLSLSRHQDRIDVASDPVLEQLLSEYAAHVIAEGHAVSRNWPYSYLALGDGTQIDGLVRELCEQFADDLERSGAQAPSPFTLAGARVFQQWLGEDAPGAPAGVNRVLARVYEDRVDLQQAFPDLRGSDRDRLLSWASRFGSDEVPLLSKVRTSGNGAAALPATVSDQHHDAPLAGGPWGVNVVGHFHAHGQTGEAARQIVAAFDAAGVASVPIQDWGAPLAGPEEPFGTVAAADASFPVNLFCFEPEALSEFLSHAGENFLAGRYSIGMWLSETIPLPSQSREVFSVLQEIWAPSTYLAAVLEPHAGIPVHAFPAPVQPAPFEPRTRAQLGLPPDGFVYLSTCGYGEDVQRKNPAAVLEAFKRAFAPSDGAHLVVSCLDRAARGELEALTEGRSDIRILEEEPLRAVVAACDCFVSLHRAEPLGLRIAEAMWLGKPVIATGYSANVDFMSAENGLLVDYRLDGQWAEPDIDHAVEQMRRAFDNPVAARSLGDRAAATIRDRHSPIAVGSLMRRRLESIRATGRAPRPVPRSRERLTAVAQLESSVRRGPPGVARAGTARRLRGVVRSALLRALKPYSAYQQRINSDLVAAVDQLSLTFSERLAGLRAEAAAERAELLAELRGARQLRSALEVQSRSVDELRRIISTQTDRSLYMALSELAARHDQIGPSPGAVAHTPGLAGFELRAYSQNGEDGVLAEALRRTGAPRRFFVEFGVESGQEGNCVYLADVAGWQGVFIEADPGLHRSLERKYSGNERVRTVAARVTPQNIEELLADADVPLEPDVISIDLDGQDYWVWEAIDRYRPRLVVIEYNSSLDPGRRLVQPNEPHRSWNGTDYFGASLGALESLGGRKGYRLVYTELSGSNAFFVREDLAALFPARADVEVRAVPNYFQTGYRHPPAGDGPRFLDLDTGELQST